MHRKPESAGTPRDSSLAQENDVFRGLTLGLAKQQWSFRTMALLATRRKIPRQTGGKKLDGAYSLSQVAAKSRTSLLPRMKHRRPARIPLQCSWSLLKVSCTLRFRIGSIGSRVQGSKFIRGFPQCLQENVDIAQACQTRDPQSFKLRVPGFFIFMSFFWKYFAVNYPTLSFIVSTCINCKNVQFSYFNWL